MHYRFKRPEARAIAHFAALAAIFMMTACNGSGPSGGASVSGISVPSAGGASASDPGPDSSVAEWEGLRARKTAADSAILAWDAAERIRLGSPTADSAALVLLPIDGSSPLTTASAKNRPFEYGRRALVFNIRRAAKYLELMRPDAPNLKAFDLSGADGGTPEDGAGLRHPSGAHVNGWSADLSYPALPGVTAVSAATLQELDVDAATWVMLSLLESPDVESVITAYHDPILARVEELQDHGLVGQEAVVRIRDGLWQDTSLGHNGHLHVNSAAVNPALLFGPSHDRYRCFMASEGSWGTAWIPKVCE